MSTFRLLVLFFAFFALPSIAIACSCAGNGPPCQNFWATPFVFSARAVDVQQVKKQVGEDSFMLETHVRFAVSAEHRGNVGVTVDLVTGAGGGDCGYSFETGKEYLVYASRNAKGVLTTGICTSTKLLEKAMDDLQFIASLGSAKPVGNVFGKVMEYKTRRSNEEWVPSSPVANIKLKLTGKAAELETITDDEGSYRFSDLLPGEYELKALVPEGFARESITEKLKVVEKGCVVTGFVLARETSASGKILDAEGNPVTKIFAELVPVEQINESYKRDSSVAEVDDNGRFTFKFLAPGTYYLGVRLRSSVLKHGYPRTFYPGTQLPENASVVIIREGDVIKDLDFQLPRKYADRKVEGIVVYPDGKPVPEANVLVQEGEFDDGAAGKQTDANGRFTLTLFEGLGYKIRAYVNLKSAEQRHAHPVEIAPKGGISNVKLVMSEPNGSCPKCRP